jgi:hypothetical protein
MRVSQALSKLALDVERAEGKASRGAVRRRRK